MDPLVECHMMLGAEQRQRLRHWAADRDTSMAALVREAIDYYLRIAMGPAPARVRSAARDAAGALPPAHEDAHTASDSPGSKTWW